MASLRNLDIAADGLTLTVQDVAQVLSLSEADTKKAIRSFADPKHKALARLKASALRELLEGQGFRYPKKNIVFHCLKGGAAKTTLAYNTAFRFAQLGARVLLVDLDKQANATLSFLEGRPEKVFVDVVTGEVPIADTIIPLAPGLDLLPSSLENARLEMELIHRKNNPKTYYRNLFAPVRDRYDAILLDMPPDLSHSTYLSTLFADTICIPTNPDEYSVYGTQLTLASIEGIRKEYDNPEQEVLVVWTKYDAREKKSLPYITDFSAGASAHVLPAVIRSDATFKYAQGKHMSVFQLAKKCNAKEDIDFLAQQLLGLQSFFEGTTLSNPSLG